MFDIPGFDVKSLSDEQLFERSADLSKKLSWSYRFSQGGGVETLTRMLQAIDLERRERNFMETWSLASAYLSAPIETDPEVRDIEREKDTKQEKANASIRTRPKMNNIKRTVSVPQATSKPVSITGPDGKK